MGSFCDDRCTNASGSSCDCECGGANHGGFSKAVDRSEYPNPLTLDDRELKREAAVLGNRKATVQDEIKKHGHGTSGEPVVEELYKELASLNGREKAVAQEQNRREEGGARLGSVSHGTMRSGDLLESFRSALEDLDKKSYRDHMYKFPDLADVDGGDSNEDIDEAINDLDDRLNNLAPDGAYFGAHPGDGSDYGFWLADED